LLAFLPFPLACALAVWLIVFLLSHYVSLASICAAVALPIATWFGYRDVTLLIFTTLIGAVAIYKHKSNIQRLLAGTENRAGKPKSASGGGAAA
jgi:glycerol-3-phosphate acyltransferase PlsY